MSPTTTGRSRSGRSAHDAARESALAVRHGLFGVPRTTVRRALRCAVGLLLLAACEVPAAGAFGFTLPAPAGPALRPPVGAPAPARQPALEDSRLRRLRPRTATKTTKARRAQRSQADLL